MLNKYEDNSTSKMRNIRSFKDNLTPKLLLLLDDASIPNILLKKNSLQDGEINA
jgi:hypothetical protein